MADYSEWAFEDKLLRALHNPSPERRILAIESLAKLNNKASLRIINQIVWDTHEDYYVVSAAIRGLAEMQSPSALRLLHRATKHPSRLISQEAERLLEKISMHPVKNG